MSNNEWKHEVVEGVDYWVNEDIGNIAKIKDSYILMIPRVIKFGPFFSLDDAKEARQSLEKLDKLLQDFNKELVVGESNVE